MSTEKKKRYFQPQIERRLDGRTFQKNGRHNDKTYYKCSTINCYATAFAKEDNVLHINKPHSFHCEKDGKDKAIEMKQWMKTEMQQKWWGFLELYDEACQRFYEAANEVQLSRIRSSLKVWRLKYFPPTPTTMQQFADQLLEGQYDCLLKYKNHKLEVGVVQDTDGYVHILFYDKEFINSNLNRITQLFIDATFATRPKLQDCMQFLNVLGIYMGRAVGMFHVLMTRRTKAAYLAVFSHIIGVNALETVQMIMSDFENPLRGSLSDIFPLAQIVGCNFHFDKAIYSKLKTLKLTDEIKKSAYLEEVIKQILALAFLPKHLIIDEYFRQKQSIDDDVRVMLSDFLSYFEKYWLNIITPAGFSVYGLSNRTNNISECFNSQLLHLFGSRPVAANMTQKLMLLTLKARRQVEQRKNFQFGSTLPRYQTQYKDAQLRKAWIMLGEPDSNYTTEDFIKSAAKLKGNLNDKLLNFRNDLITLQTEMTTRPTIVPMSKDIEFDVSLVMDPAARRVYDQLKKKSVMQDEDIPHFYRENDAQVTIKRLEDEARVILADIDKYTENIQPFQAPENQNVVENQNNDEIDLNQSRTEDNDNEAHTNPGDDEVIPPQRNKKINRGVLFSATPPELTSQSSHTTLSHVAATSFQLEGQSRKTVSNRSTLQQPNNKLTNRSNLQKADDKLNENEVDVNNDVEEEDSMPDWLTNTVRMTDAHFQDIVEEIKATINLPQEHCTNSSTIPETPEVNSDTKISRVIIDDSDKDMFASDNEVIPSSVPASCIQNIPGDIAAENLEKGAKKKSRPGLKQRLRHLKDKIKKNPKKKRKRSKKAKENNCLLQENHAKPKIIRIEDGAKIYRLLQEMNN